MAAAEEIYTRVFDYLRSDPSQVPFDGKLFEEATLILPSHLTKEKDNWEPRLLLMRHLATCLTNPLFPDHTPLVNLQIALLEDWTWNDVCEFGTGSIPYKDGLAVAEGMSAFNRLMLTLLSKATANAVSAEQAAGLQEAMMAVVKLWLTGPETGVSLQAGELLYRLLEVDGPGRAGSQGLVWKRIFGDRDVYNVFFESTSLKYGLQGLNKNQKTIAQARLMEWLPKVARLDWTAASRSHHKEVEEKYKCKGGLLDYAALQMVDVKDDVLMHRCLIDFFSDLLKRTAALDTHTMAQHDSQGLQYMIMHGLHARTAAIYLQTQPVDPLDAMFLYGPAANYLAIYASEYPEHYLAGQMPAQVNERLLSTLNLTPGRWAHSDSPKHDLHLLASLPRQSLLSFGASPITLLPSKSTNADALNTLATLFHGPEQKALTFPHRAGQESAGPSDEAGAARALYFNYLAKNPRFWADIVTHSDTVALLDQALAGLNCLTAVITANWSSASSSSYTLPSTSIPTPESGHLAILSPPALEHVLPYLLSPPKTFAALVGGGRGDAEGSAYKVAAAKFDALKALRSQLQGQVEKTPNEGYEDILATVEKRLAQGPMGAASDVGGAVGTLEL